MLIGIFGGTTEGHYLVDYLGNSNEQIDVFVATPQGKDVLNNYDNVNILVGKKDEDELFQLFSNKHYDLIIDATHPYAQIVSKNVKNVCDKLKIELIKVRRDIENNNDSFLEIDDIINYLNEHEGSILLTTGSKNLKDFTKIKDYQTRVYPRILPALESLNIAVECGYNPANIIAMYGPFSTELNISLIKEYNIKYLVTKNSGTSGGFKEKEEACILTNTKMLVLGLKEKNEGISLKETINLLNERIKITKEINIIGCGMGNINELGIDTLNLINNSDLVIGSTRLINNFNHPNKKALIKSEEIKELIDNTPYKKISVLFSGDVNFFSGAKKLINQLDGYHIRIINGLSSMAYLASIVNLSYEEAYIKSLHGRDSYFINHVNLHELCFFLLGGTNNVEFIIRKLNEYGLGDCKLYIGERLSYDDEKITIDKAKNLINQKFDSLASIFVYNPNYEKNLSCGYKDQEFIKKDIPLTKEEIRAITLAKMKLQKDYIVYDIGAGTGSVSIEIARIIEDGIVYAIEKDQDAINVLKENKLKFKCDNIEIIEGMAPDVINDLALPDVIFIGGSGKRLLDILEFLKTKECNARIVLNAITLETINEAMTLFNKYGYCVEVTQVSISKNRKLGDYNLMMAQNPVYIFEASK